MVIGYYEGKKLVYSARVRNGLTPATRVQLFCGSPLVAPLAGNEKAICLGQGVPQICS
ncbi:hypothetical protein ACPOL_3429 [Acidisarcina polymorpha]|uniref:Uncharacterized protein n=1 Tax=Acidisarcina polymorpha TaxID=2211140 RepID=A0A2Z5G2F8_9BACT|nr:hypothetical protein ACPOL_3429 [Acidisarcina polymorpha]